MFLHYVYLPTFYISCCQPEFSGDVIAVTYTIIVNGGYVHRCNGVRFSAIVFRCAVKGHDVMVSFSSDLSLF